MNWFVPHTGSRYSAFTIGVQINETWYANQFFWKLLTSTQQMIVLFQIFSNCLSEYRIKNSIYFTCRFALSKDVPNHSSITILFLQFSTSSIHGKYWRIVLNWVLVLLLSCELLFVIGHFFEPKTSCKLRLTFSSCTHKQSI